jgi:hypothetical protein
LAPPRRVCLNEERRKEGKEDKEDKEERRTRRTRRGLTY